jgi:hypothetical protein
MEFYSAMKKNNILSSASKWMDLENIILREVSQPQKNKNRVSFLHSILISNEDIIPKRNAVILLDMGHTLKGEHIQEE